MKNVNFLGSYYIFVPAFVHLILDISSSNAVGIPVKKCEQNGEKIADSCDCYSYYVCVVTNPAFPDRYDYYLDECTHSICETPISYFNTTISDCAAGPCPATERPLHCQNGSGLYHHPTNCYGYYKCMQRGSLWYTYEFTCPGTTKWNMVEKRCSPETVSLNSERSYKLKKWLSKKTNILDYLTNNYAINITENNNFI